MTPLDAYRQSIDALLGEIFNFGCGRESVASSEKTFGDSKPYTSCEGLNSESAIRPDLHPIQFTSPAGVHHSAVSHKPLDGEDVDRAGDGFFLDEDFVPRTIDQHELDVERPEFAPVDDDGKPEHF